MAAAPIFLPRVFAMAFAFCLLLVLDDIPSVSVTLMDGTAVASPVSRHADALEPADKTASSWTGSCSQDVAT